MKGETLFWTVVLLVIVGARLVRLADLVREQKLAVVRTLPDRYSELEPHQSFVAEIIIRPVGKPVGFEGLG